MVCDLELIKDIYLLYSKEIVIWGAGNNGNMAYEKLQTMLEAPINAGNTIWFCDTDRLKWESGDKNVISPAALLKLAAERKILVLIASDYVDEIICQMEQMGLLKMVDVCTWFGLQTAVHFHFQEEIFDREFQEAYLFQLHLNAEILKAHASFHFLSDERGLIYIAAYEQPVYIIEPGEIGSTTLFSSLQKRGVPCATSHNLCFLKEKQEENKKEEMWFFRRMFEALKESGIRVIVAVREPIVRDISVFWSLMHVLLHGKAADPDLILFFQKVLKSVYTSLEDPELIPFESCNQTAKPQFGDQGKWFRETIEELFDIDVFAYPFDKEKGYTVIRQDNIQMLILQMEKMNQLEAVIGEFVGMEDFVLESENEAKTRLSYPAQREFMEKVVLPRDYVERCYGKESFVRHFYSEADQAKFLAKWKKHIE